MPQPFNTVPHVVVTPLPCLEEATSPLWQAIENFPLQAPSANRSLQCHRLTSPPTHQAVTHSSPLPPPPPPPPDPSRLCLLLHWLMATPVKWPFSPQVGNHWVNIIPPYVSTWLLKIIRGGISLNPATFPGASDGAQVGTFSVAASGLWISHGKLGCPHLCCSSSFHKLAKTFLFRLAFSE